MLLTIKIKSVLIKNKEKNKMQVLTEKKVVRLIGLWNRGLTQKEIASKLKVPFTAVAHVTKRSTWKQFSHLITRG